MSRINEQIASYIVMSYVIEKLEAYKMNVDMLITINICHCMFIIQPSTKNNKNCGQK